jgi:hypothetical protein
MSSVSNLQRLIGPRVMFKLSSLIFNTNLNSSILKHDKFFIDFVQESYGVKYESRPSISQLCSILTKYGCVKSNLVAIEYAIQLERIAFENDDHFFSI